MSIESVIPSNHFIHCRLLLLLLSVLLNIRVFSNDWLFASGGQSIGVSPSASVLPINIQGWFPLGLSDLISLLSKWLSKVFSSTTVQKHQFFSAQLSLWSISHPYMTTGKTIALTIQTFVGKVMSLLFNTLFRFVLSFFPRNKSLNFMAAVTIHSDSGAQENKICHCCLFFPIYLPWSDGTRCWDLHFLNVEFLSQLSHSPLSLSSRDLVVLCFLPLKWYHLHILGFLYFSQQSWFQLVSHPAWHLAWCI